MNVLIFGYGFIGAAFGDAAQAAGHQIRATVRTPQRRQFLDSIGVSTVPAGNASELSRAVKTADGILISPAPDDSGCPAFAWLSEMDLGGKWIGYLSTTGVYGDRGGGWVFEASARLPTSTEGRRRVVAEDQWLSRDAHIFRLPGLYGPGRSAIERLKDGTARRIVKDGHVFSRLHHDDCAAALLASFNSPRPGRVYNLCDDEPAPAGAVTEYAAHLTGLPVPPEIAWDDPSLSPAIRRFYVDNKRVSNARAKAELGWHPQYPTYREGLQAIQAAIKD